MRYVTTWHFAAASGFRFLMAALPVYYTSRNCRFLVRLVIGIIITLIMLLSAHIFWWLVFQEQEPDALGISDSRETRRCQMTCNLSSYFTWRVVDFLCAIVLPLSIVISCLIALPMVLRHRYQSSKSSMESISQQPVPRTRRRQTEVMAVNLATMLYYQDVAFVTFATVLFIYNMLNFFPPVQPSHHFNSFLGHTRPFANLLQYSLNVIQFPIYAFSNRSTRRVSGLTACCYPKLQLAGSKENNSSLSRGSRKNEKGGEATGSTTAVSSTGAQVAPAIETISSMQQDLAHHLLESFVTVGDLANSDCSDSDNDIVDFDGHGDIYDRSSLHSGVNVQNNPSIEIV